MICSMRTTARRLARLLTKVPETPRAGARARLRHALKLEMRYLPEETEDAPGQMLRSAVTNLIESLDRDDAVVDLDPVRNLVREARVQLVTPNGEPINRRVRARLQARANAG